MVVTLNVETGPAAGRRIRLLPDQTVQVGRAAMAEVAVPTDMQLADYHFAVLTSHGDCRICDLDTSGGTFVNGERIGQACVQHGDRIQAGSTAFQVSMEGATPQPAVGKPRRAESIQPPRDAFHYRTAQSPAGLTVYVGDPGTIGVAELVAQFRKAATVHMLVTPTAPRSLLDSLADSDAYVTNETKPAWRQYFPLLTDVDMVADHVDAIPHAWAEDSIAYLVAEHTHGRLLAHLRNQAASFSSIDVLRTQLDQCPRNFVSRLLTGMIAVIVKEPETSGWKLYVNSQSPTCWQDLGFPRPPR